MFVFNVFIVMLEMIDQPCPGTKFTAHLKLNWGHRYFKKASVNMELKVIHCIQLLSYETCITTYISTYTSKIKHVEGFF